MTKNQKKAIAVAFVMTISASVVSNIVTKTATEMVKAAFKEEG